MFKFIVCYYTEGSFAQPITYGLVLQVDPEGGKNAAKTSVEKPDPDLSSFDLAGSWIRTVFRIRIRIQIHV